MRKDVVSKAHLYGYKEGCVCNCFNATGLRDPTFSEVLVCTL